MIGKRLLVLGGKPIGSCEIVLCAKRLGIYTIVTDYLTKEQSPAKLLADECWDISTAEVDLLAGLVKERQIDGIYTGVHEFNISRMIEISEATGLPCFCTKNQWNQLVNKRRFKELCRGYGIPVTKEYHLSSLDDPMIAEIEYPVITKPADGSGSRGFSICNTPEELRAAFANAAMFSSSGEVLVERKMPYENSAIINYTIQNGEVVFSGISDKHSKKVFESGAPIMSVQFYPSLYQKQYLESLNQRAKDLFRGMGLRNGVLWIEAFCEDGSFTFNEIGYRFGGSLTYLPISHAYGIDQLSAQIEYAVTGQYRTVKTAPSLNYGKTYTIFPVHVRPGKITGIEGLDMVKADPRFKSFVPVHFLGDDIQNWGSAQQVFAYLHYETETRRESEQFADWILQTLRVTDQDGQNMLFNLFR